MPKTLVRALVKFVKFMHDNNQTTKVAKACHSTCNTQLVFKPWRLRYGGGKLSYKGLIIKHNHLKCDLLLVVVLFIRGGKQASRRTIVKLQGWMKYRG